MGINTWLARKGASGFTSSLLLLYTDAAASGIRDEKERWANALCNTSSLPVSLSASNKKAIERTLEYGEWESEPAPEEVAEKIVVLEAIIVYGGRPGTDYTEALRKGVREQIVSFRKKYPNRAIFLDNPNTQQIGKFKELEAMFDGDREAENYAKATWLVSRGNSYGDKDMLDEALKEFEEALRLQPDHLPAHVSRVMVFARKGEKEKARKLFKEMPDEMKVNGQVVATKKEIVKKMEMETNWLG